ncbi:hypothetical protein CAF53_12875 [Sphingobium sp. LB126]|nr:hypothetical protein CAF53_12875 [Sphingobium sp. LB126]
MIRIDIFILVLFGVVMVTPSSLAAQATPGDDDFAFIEIPLKSTEIESLEIALAQDLGTIEQSNGPASADKMRASLYGLFSRPYVWTKNTISVCFDSVDTAMMGRVAGIASEWNDAGAPVTLDFGDKASPRRCGAPGVPGDISVAFSLPGMPAKGGTSRIGRGSSRAYPSMVLSGLAAAKDDPAKFRFLVLHEFGHALGLLHELKNADGKCWDEIKEPTLVQYYTDEFGISDLDAIREQIRTFDARDMQGIGSTGFDRTSIMMYALPARVFKAGTNSPCFAPLASDISPRDKQTLRAAYSSSLIPISELSRLSSGLSPERRKIYDAYIVYVTSDGTAQAKIRSALKDRPALAAPAMADRILSTAQAISIERYGRK